MTLIRRNYNDFPTISNWLEDFFYGDNENFLLNPKTTVPKVNISENNDGYTVEIAAPGLKKDDFKVDLEHDVLTISAKSEEKKEEEKKNYTKREFSFTSFTRSFTLPQSADKETISAKYDSGVLNLTIAKKQEAIVKPARTISIE